MSALETTNQTQPVVDLGQDHLLMYGKNATKLVADGYASIQSALEHAKATGRLTKGKLLVEVVHSPNWTMPNLMSTEKLETFQKQSREYLPEGVLQAIWYILENVCGESQLVPALVLNRSTGLLVVKLQ